MVVDQRLRKMVLLACTMPCSGQRVGDFLAVMYGTGKQ